MSWLVLLLSSESCSCTKRTCGGSECVCLYVFVRLRGKDGNTRGTRSQSENSRDSY